MIDPDSGATTSVKASCVGPLAIHIDAFAARLGGEGFTSRTVHDKCELVAKPVRVALSARSFAGCGRQGQLDHFHADRRRQGHVRRGEVATGQQLLGYLRDIGCVRALPPGLDTTPLGNLTRDFERHLSSERGLSPATLVNYLPIVRGFLVERFGGKALQFDDLRRSIFTVLLCVAPRPEAVAALSWWSPRCARFCAFCCSGARFRRISLAPCRGCRLAPVASAQVAAS